MVIKLTKIPCELTLDCVKDVLALFLIFITLKVSNSFHFTDDRAEV